MNIGPSCADYLSKTRSQSWPAAPEGLPPGSALSQSRGRRASLARRPSVSSAAIQAPPPAPEERRKDGRYAHQADGFFRDDEFVVGRLDPGRTDHRGGLREELGELCLREEWDEICRDDKRNDQDWSN
jgi:hypothetical protein